MTFFSAKPCRHKGRLCLYEFYATNPNGCMNDNGTFDSVRLQYAVGALRRDGVWVLFFGADTFEFADPLAMKSFIASRVRNGYARMIRGYFDLKRREGGVR